MSDFENFPAGRGMVELIWLTCKAEGLCGCFNLSPMESQAQSPSLIQDWGGLQRACGFYWTKGQSWNEQGSFWAPQPLVTFERAAWHGFAWLTGP